MLIHRQLPGAAGWPGDWLSRTAARQSTRASIFDAARGL